LCDKILEFAKPNESYAEIKVNLQQGKSKQKIEAYELKEDGIFMHRHMVHVPNDQMLKNLFS
jgi:hypothetical protein